MFQAYRTNPVAPVGPPCRTKREVHAGLQRAGCRIVDANHAIGPDGSVVHIVRQNPGGLSPMERYPELAQLINANPRAAAWVKFNRDGRLDDAMIHGLLQLAVDKAHARAGITRDIDEVHHEVRTRAFALLLAEPPGPDRSRENILTKAAMAGGLPLLRMDTSIWGDSYMSERSRARLRDVDAILEDYGYFDSVTGIDEPRSLWFFGSSKNMARRRASRDRYAAKRAAWRAKRG